MAQLEEDSEYRRKTKASEAQRHDRVEELRRAERPIVNDLRAAGVDVESIWDLVNASAPYPDALPVLLKHLEQGGYPDRVMESLARALAVGPAAPAWDALRELYLHAQGRGEMEGLAVALAAAATEDHLDDLISLLDEPSRGDTRIHLLHAIKRVGGDRGLSLLDSLQTDPLFGREAQALLKTRT